MVWVGSAIGLLGIAGAWLVARTVSRRAHRETRAEVVALRTELAGALARISSREEAAAIMARVDAAVADEPAKKRRAGLVLIKGGLAVAGVAGGAASLLARRAREHPGIALVAATAAVGTTAVALLSPFSGGGTPHALREPPAPVPSASAPATSPTQPTPTPTPTGTRPNPGLAQPVGSDPAVSAPADLTPGTGETRQPADSDEPRPPQSGPSTPPDSPGSDPAPDPDPTAPGPTDPGPTDPPTDPDPDPTPTPTPTPTPPPPDPSSHCTVQLGHLVCIKLPLPL